MLSRRQSPVLSTTENSRWMNVNIFVLNDTSAVAFSIFRISNRSFVDFATALLFSALKGLLLTSTDLLKTK